MIQRSNSAIYNVFSIFFHLNPWTNNSHNSSAPSPVSQNPLHRIKKKQFNSSLIIIDTPSPNVIIYASSTIKNSVLNFSCQWRRIQKYYSTRWLLFRLLYFQQRQLIPPKRTKFASTPSSTITKHCKACTHYWINIPWTTKNVKLQSLVPYNSHPSTYVPFKFY